MEVESQRERNRKAATRHRAKNKEEKTKIIINLNALEETHNCLKQEVSNLQNEVIQLKERSGLADEIMLDEYVTTIPTVPIIYGTTVDANKFMCK
ncbi:hypothetical protein RhiirA5_429363 [Rhizophagus irregularis]|uniref:BZIP domain-containing protein n=1 Tax=Rhizophagus irregularis TaxID=588596 RepID=A0A2N0NYK9_9GLOM|nr:hypothetical protein RhiirA5_429363 [Rhizophagus irregularis]GET64366.1 hypothetical protein GLOIN_2v1482523 [Rhizophagus irregularis DAOM 181602=DAOM 197198]